MTTSDLPPLRPRDEVRSSSPPKRINSPRNPNDWAPLHPQPLPASSSLHLPPAPDHTHRSSSYRTSNPNSHPSPLQSSITFSLSRLLSLPSFARLLTHPAGLKAFKSYLTALHSPLLPTLGLYIDALALRQLTGDAAAAARGIRDVYLLPDAEESVEMGGKELREAVEGLRKVMDGRTALDGTARRLLENLYEGEFEGYVKHKLLAHTKLQLEKRELQAESVGGLGEAFVLSNPRLPDQPIVLASPAFCSLTGYDRSEIIGRNCRFLQGEATNPADVIAVKNAIRKREGVTQLLLNYTKDGQPFFNLLCIIPVFSPHGELTYFVGGQTNITGALTASSGLVLPSAAPGSTAPDVEDDLSDVFSHASLSSDLSKFSTSVQRASTPLSEQPDPTTSDSASPSLSSNGSILDSTTPSPAGPTTPVFSFPSSSDFESPRQKRSGRTMVSPSFGNILRFGGGGGSGHKSTGSIDSDSGSTGVDREKKEAKRISMMQGTVERRVEEFRGTYERVAVIRAEGRRILHLTSSFLRYIGVPGTSEEEVNKSPLLGVDLLDLIRTPGTAGGKEKEETAELRKLVKGTVEGGKSLSVECGIRVEQKKGLVEKIAPAPTARGVLHLTPVQDYDGKSVVYIAIFA